MRRRIARTPGRALGRYALLAVAAVSCGQGAPAAAGPPRAEFGSPRRVEILGYRGSAMEPYISCDGRYLFFNNRNGPAEQTDVLFAEKAEGDAFRFRGPVPGVNQPPPVLDAVPSLDAQNELFFISTRSYETTLSTVYSGELRDGRSLEYAPATSADGLELFFTRLEGRKVVILRATRSEASLPFGRPEPVAGLGGFVEAPSLSCDGGTLYYHLREGSEFSLFKVTRAR